MKILITGGCGFVGLNLSLYLKRNLNNSQIFTIDNLSRLGSKARYNRLKLNNIKNFKIDISNFKSVMGLPRFDLIVDCCAEAAVGDSIKKPKKVFDTNLVGTFNIINKCKKDKSDIIFLSTSRVYSINLFKNKINLNSLNKKNLKKFRVNENCDVKDVKSLYGFTKLSSEDLIKEYSYINRIKYIINRFGVISGPWQFGHEDQGFVSLWLISHLLKKNLKYIGFEGKGLQMRDVIHVEDVCEIILLQIKNINRIHNKTFNIGGGIKNLISLKMLTNLCENITKNKIKFSSIKKTSLFDIPIFLTNNSKIKKYYKWKPKRNINLILKDIYDWTIRYEKIIKKVFL